MRYYGQWNPPVDKWIHEHFFPDLKSGFFIEAGASDGVTENSCKFFEEYYNWEGINIEPDKYNYNSLCINRPLSLNLNVGLSDKEEDVTFDKAIHPIRGQRFGNGSIKHDLAHKQALINDGCTFEQYSIHTITYTQLIEQYSIDKVDLMVLDVEGHELAALRGMKPCPVKPSIMCVEHGVLGLPILNPAMSDLGYKYVNSSFNNSFYKLIT